jgi:hypothetical protein
MEMRKGKGTYGVLETRDWLIAQLFLPRRVTVYFLQLGVIDSEKALFFIPKYSIC